MLVSKVPSPMRSFDHDPGQLPPTAPVIPYARLREPGTYLCCWNGQLLRLPVLDLGSQAWPEIAARPGEPVREVRKLSDDPALPMEQARAAAGKLGFPVSF